MYHYWICNTRKCILILLHIEINYIGPESIHGGNADTSLAEIQERSELWGKQVNAQKESLKNFQSSCKSMKKCAMKMKETK